MAKHEVLTYGRVFKLNIWLNSKTKYMVKYVI